MSKHETLGIYDYARNKICDLYDSQTELIGQAYSIQVTKNIDGLHDLRFELPYMVDVGGYSADEVSALYGMGRFGISRFGTMLSSSGNKNFRWEFMKSDYLIRYTCGSKNIWFVASKPQKSKSGKKIYGTVTCSGYESLLKTRNLYMTFDDENGIGTIEYLMVQILKGTGWSYDSDHSDTLYERDGTTEKIRSLQSDGKKGALDLIKTVCNLFQARPIFDTDAETVTIKAMRNREQVLEGEVGTNLTAITVNHDSSNIATRVYIEGEYGDYGYVGIDDVEVDGEPYGLPFIMNFDYYREIGVFTTAHETALANYLADIKDIKQDIRDNGTLMIAVEDQLNNMIGQCNMVVYYKDESLVTPMYIYGAVTSSQTALNVGDEVVILKNNGTHTYETWLNNPSEQLDGAYGVAKFVTKSAGKIGAAEVQIEAKQKSITQLQRKIEVTVNPDTIAEYNAEIARLAAEITLIYTGDEENDGLYDMMQDVMDSEGLLYQFDYYSGINDDLNEEQDDIEATFIAAMGYMLRDGYWNDNNYTIGQEDYLYADALDIVAEMSKPATSYTFSYVRVTEDFGIPAEDITINAIFKLYDKELEIDDKLFVTKITYGVDNKSLGSIEVSNQDITLTGSDLSSLLSRMSQLADLVEQKNALYERAKALNSNGSMYADRLNGQIDVMKNKILSSVSNWMTDDNGNIVFTSADGNSAVMLSGAGIMLASDKTDSGDWNWRTCMDGRGMTADEIVAGFISAERIEAGSITTNKLASDVGSSLDLSSNVALNATITSIAEQKAAEMQLTDQQFQVMFNRTVATGINNSINDVNNNLSNYKTEVSNYMRYDNTGTLTLGDTQSNFKTQITNTRMSFLEAYVEVAYISNNSLFITNARVTDTLSVGTADNGYFDWTVTPTGLGLKWRNT